jgi:valyl-tRNA synthetase
VAPYPQVIRKQDINVHIDQAFDLVERLVYILRNIRGEMKLPPSTATQIHIVGSENDPNFLLMKNHLNIVSALVRIQKIEMHTHEPNLGFVCTGMLENLKIIVPLPEELLKQENMRLNKEQERLKLSIEKLEAQLNNEEFVSKAPSQLIDKQKILLQQSQKELLEIIQKLKEFKFN